MRLTVRLRMRRTYSVSAAEGLLCRYTPGVGVGPGRDGAVEAFGKKYGLLKTIWSRISAGLRNL